MPGIVWIDLLNPSPAETEFVERSTGLHLPDLSMGTSNDFEVAVEEGATLVRIGTTLFDGLAVGERGA